VARAFRRAGYVVYALVRNLEKGQDLIRDEIIPVVGDQSKPETYKDRLAEATIVIDTITDFSTAPDFAKANRILTEQVAELSNTDPLNPKTLIYTSGGLVYGDHPNHLVDETTPFDHNIARWRMDHEKKVLTLPNVNGIVIRPGFVYGYSGSNSASLLKSVEAAKESGQPLRLSGRKDRRWSWVHLDDLAAAYVLAAGKPQSVTRGQVFNVATSNSPTFEEINQRLASIIGFAGPIEWVEASSWFEKFSNVTVRYNPQKAVDILGWSPRHVGFLEELEVYARAIKAAPSGAHST